MSDAEYLFNESIREKKGMVNGARHTKGKVKRNGRPRDLDVSEKEYKERCGQVQKFSLSMPMSLGEFKELPTDLQKEYFRRLVDIIHMERSIISKMLGCSYPTVVKLMEKCGYKYIAIRGRKFTKYHNDWRNFFARDERFAHIMDSFDKTENPAEDSNEKQNAQETKEVTEEATQVSVQESAKKTPEIITMSVRIYANTYDELISQLEGMRGQPIMGQTLTIEVVKG